MSAKRATPDQRARLYQISQGYLKRTGRFSVCYHMHNNTSPTWPMVDRLERAGWIDWKDNVAFLTPAGADQMERRAADKGTDGQDGAA